MKIVAITLVCAMFTGCATQTASYNAPQPQLFQTSQQLRETQERQRQQQQYEAQMAARPVEEKMSTAAKVVIGAGLAVTLYALSGAVQNKACHTGPRGGTYTITSGGNKNYAGC